MSLHGNPAGAASNVMLHTTYVRTAVPSTYDYSESF
jgi:hypothetical protein